MKLFLMSVGLILSCVSGVAFACTGGQEFTARSGMYTVDVTNDVLDIRPKQTVHFDFALINFSDPAYKPLANVPFDRVYVTLKQGSLIVLQKDIPAGANRELTGFDYTFPDVNATYTIAVQYFTGTTAMSQAEFPFTVGTGSPAAGFQANKILAVLLIIAALGVIGFKVIRPAFFA